MNKGSIILIFICLLLPAIGAEKNWLEIAKQLDTPAIGAVVRKLEPGSEADVKGLKVGETIHQINGVYYGFKRENPREDLKIEVYSPTTKKNRIIELSQDGLYKVYSNDFSHPWVSYLRGEIGVRGEWDQNLVKFMVNLFQVGSANADNWKAIVEQGYPVEDKLYNLIEMTMQWQSGQSILASEYHSQWGENPMPDTVFHLLEQMAISTNDGKLLKELAQRSSEKLRMSSNDVAKWVEMTGGASNPRNGHKLMEYAKSIRTKRIEKEFRYTDRDKKIRLAPKTMSKAHAGKYQLVLVKPPVDYKKREFHYQVKFSAVGFATTKWLSEVRIGAYIDESFTTLGSIGVRQSHKGDTSLATQGFGIDYHMFTKNHPQFPKRLPNGRRKNRERAPDMTLDLILLNDECAVFMNGQSQGHWKIDPSDDPISLAYFICGVIAELKDIKIWELDSSIEN